MKKILFLLLALCLLTVSTACGGGESAAPTPTQTVSPEAAAPEPTPAVPIYADQLKEGTYSITVDSSSSMFRVVDCALIVENGTMKAVMTMSGKGYGMVYMGTGAEALADSEDAFIPFVPDENGAKTFTVPIEALDMEVDCAAWSIRKEKWYDRTLIFQSDALPAGALIEG